MRRLGNGWLILAALLALVGIYGFGSSVTWLLSMAEAPDTAWLALPAAGAALACLLLMIAVPLFKSWRPPLWARILIPLLGGVFGIVAAVGTFTLANVTACDYQCRPVDTWKILPTVLASGVLCGLGPGLWALTDRRDRGELLWPITVAVVVIGAAVGLYQWVENGLY